MSKKIKAWLIAAASLIVVGLIAFTAVMTHYGWDFTKLSRTKYQTNTYQVDETFDRISIDTDTADVRFVRSQDDTCKVVCTEQEKIKYAVSVENNELTVHMIDERKWYDHIGFFFGENEMIVYLPLANYNSLTLQSETGDVEIASGFTFESITISLDTGDVESYANTTSRTKITTTTGDIDVENATVNALELNTTTGDIDVENVTCTGEIRTTSTAGDVELQNVTCDSCTSVSTTGDISLVNTIATATLSLKTTTGDVELNRCDGGEIVVETSTGDVSGSLLTGKTFITDSNTGDIRVPQNTNGGNCQITTDTGDIYITIA